MARVGRRKPGEDGRGRLAPHLERVAADDPHKGSAARTERGKAHHVVLDDHVRSYLGDDLAQAWLRVFRTVDERLVRGTHERLELIERRLAELWSCLGDEVRPELARILCLCIWRRLGKIDERFLESVRLELPLPGCLAREHHPVTALDQEVAEPDALIGRPVRGLGEEKNRQWSRRHVVSFGFSGWPVAARAYSRISSAATPLSIVG